MVFVAGEIKSIMQKFWFPSIWFQGFYIFQNFVLILAFIPYIGNKVFKHINDAMKAYLCYCHSSF